MATIPEKFGTYLPPNFANLANRSLADWGGYSNMPAYLQELAMSSQAPSAAAGASPANSPSAVAPAAGGGYAQLKWQGNRGMGGIPQFIGNATPSYQIPVEQLADFMKSGYGSNFEATGSFADGQSIAPKMTVGTYTDPMTGEIGKHLLYADKDPTLGYRTVGGTYLPDNSPGWQIGATAAAPAAEETKPAATTEAANAGASYVLGETPDAFKYAEGGFVDIEKEDEDNETLKLIQQSKELLRMRDELAKSIRPLTKEEDEERRRQELERRPQYAEGGLVQVAEQLRDKGRMGDSILAHISPDEARLLKSMGGAGTINPDTGLPEYFSFKKLLGIAAPVIGNLIAPGIGGILGGVAGGALTDGVEGALMGGLGGLGGLMGSSMLGGGGQGFGLGNLLSAFGGGGQQKSGWDDKNAWINPDTGLPVSMGGGGGGLSGKNLAMLGGLGLAGAGAFANRNQNEKNMKMLREQERERQEREDEDSRNFRDLLDQPVRTYNAPPADYYAYGNRPEYKYFSDYGKLEMPERKLAKGGYIGESGLGGGQDDTVPARLSNNEYVIPADVVSHLGDGTPKEGARKLDKMVGNVRKHKAVKGHPPKAKPIKRYTGGLG